MRKPRRRKNEHWPHACEAWGANKLKLTAALAAATIIAGCESTSVTELPLGPSRVMLQITTGTEWTEEVMLKAAESTIAHGYTHFLLDHASAQNQSEVIKMKDRGYGRVTPVTVDYTEVSVTVNMFKSATNGAFDAKQIVAAQKKRK